MPLMMTILISRRIENQRKIFFVITHDDDIKIWRLLHQNIQIALIESDWLARPHELSDVSFNTPCTTWHVSEKNLVFKVDTSKIARSETANFLVTNSLELSVMSWLRSFLWDIDLRQRSTSCVQWIWKILLTYENVLFFLQCGTNIVKHSNVCIGRICVGCQERTHELLSANEPYYEWRSSKFWFSWRCYVNLIDYSPEFKVSELTEQIWTLLPVADATIKFSWC